MSRRLNPWPTPYLIPSVLTDAPGEFAKNSSYPSRFCRMRVADAFQTSVTATAIRFVELGSFPAILVCTQGKKLWFHRGPAVPISLWPHTPGKTTFAADVVRGTAASGRGNVHVDEWLNGAESRHSIHEDSRRIGDESVLTLLWWTDERPLAEISERDEGRSARRSDWRDDD